MKTLLFLAFTEPDGTLARGAAEALSLAVQANAALPQSSLVVGLIGTTVEPALPQLAGCGATRVVAVSGAAFAHSRYGTDALAAEMVTRTAMGDVVVSAGTPRANRCLPGVAARLQGRADTHVTAIETAAGSLAIHRWYYRQRMEAVLVRTHRPWFVLLESGAAPAWQPPANAALLPALETLAVTIPETATRTEVVGIQEPAATSRTIRPDADLLFVAGAGWTKKQADGQTHLADAAQLILDFLQRTRASLGSSKSLVDLGGEGQPVLPFLTHLNQIGQTGATPRHPKGLSTCCHGEEPHTVGWRFIPDRRAISLDPNCGWSRGKADVLYVADAFQVLEHLNARLAAAPASPG